MDVEQNNHSFYWTFKMGKKNSLFQSCERLHCCSHTWTHSPLLMLQIVCGCRTAKHSTNRSVSLLNWPRPTSLTAHRRNWYERAGMRSPTVTPVDSGSILANSTVQGASETGQTSMKSEVWATESEWRMTLLSAFIFLRKNFSGTCKLKFKSKVPPRL